MLHNEITPTEATSTVERWRKSMAKPPLCCEKSLLSACSMSLRRDVSAKEKRDP